MPNSCLKKSKSSSHRAAIYSERSERVIYADNAATTRISDVAFEKMLPFLQEQYGNASSQYSLGVKAKRAIEQARRQVASAIGAGPADITVSARP